MEEKVSLALAVKLKKMFEDKDRFLTFPLGAAYNYRDLDFMKDQSDLSAQERLRFKAGFARLMNAIPVDGSTVFSDLGPLLWDETESVLINADFATSTLSPSEEKQLAQAIDFLTDEDPEMGIPIPSPAYKAYRVYRDLYFAAEKTYLDEKQTVDGATGQVGQELKKIWESGREQELRRIKDDAMNDWTNLGFRSQVETHQRLRNILELKRSPILYAQDCLSEIDLAEIGDLDSQGLPFCVTFFGPPDAFDKSLPWMKVSLLRQEIEGLVRKAPAGLNGTFSAGQGNDDIESLTLEYKYVDVVRPWFRPEFFHSRYWKMPQGTVVCNGAVPRQGKIPAYITGLLAVRNITVTKKKTTGAKDNVLPILHKLPVQKLRVNKLVQSTLMRAAMGPLRVADVKVARPVVIRDHRSAKKPVRGLPKVAARPSGRSTFFTVAHIAPKPKTVSKKAKRRIKPKPKAKSSFIRAKYVATAVKAPRLRPALIKRSPITQPSSVTDTVTQKYSFDGVAILAYLCRRLPKAPNPDPTLQW